MSTARSVGVGDFRGVVELLEVVEDLPPGANGTLVFEPGNRSGGAVFVDDRRVCWAAAFGMSRRLTDILVAQSGTLDRVRVEEVVRACRSTEEPIGEALVASGLVTEGQLERALARHTSESLLALAALGETPRWVAHNSGFAPRWRLPGAKVLAHVGALLSDVEPPDLSWLAGLEVDVIVYGRSNGAGIVPVEVVGAETLGVRAVSEIGPWIASEFDLSRAIDAAAHNVVLTTSAGVSVSAWSLEGLLYAAVCSRRGVLPRVLSRYLDRTRSLANGTCGRS